MKYEIGKQIRLYREMRGINQKELATRIGVSNSRVSNWELGINRPDADILILLCQVLDVSADELLDIHKTAPTESRQEPSKDAMRIATCYDAADDRGRSLLEHVANYIALAPAVPFDRSADRLHAVPLTAVLADEPDDSQIDTVEVDQKQNSED